MKAQALHSVSTQPTGAMHARRLSTRSTLVKTLASAVCLLLAMAGFAQPPADKSPTAAPAKPQAPGAPAAPAAQPEPSPLDTHPPAGHPVVLKPGADWPKARAEDVSSIEAIVAAYYASTSGGVGQPREWERFKSLFHPEARLIPARPTGDGGSGAFFLSVGDYIAQNQKYFEKSGFIDSEAARRVETFGNIAHVWSTYESRRTSATSEPYAAGIASIQLMKDNNRWWIMNIFWDHQREGNMIPEKYKTTPAAKP